MSLQMNRAPHPYIFDHIFKTGGTSFHQAYMIFAFREDQRFTISGDLDQNAEDIEALKTVAPEKRRRYRIIAGHSANALRPFFPESRYITLIREPVSRVVSAYLHAKFHPDMRAFLNDAISVEKIAIAEFVEGDFLAKRYARFCSVHNYQSEFLCDLPPMGKSDSFDEGELEAAFKRYYFIGLTEEFHSFLFLLHLTDGFPLTLFTNLLVRKEGNGFVLSEKERALIVQYNRRDVALYELAKERFWAKRERLWNVRVAALWRSYRKALAEFQIRKQFGETAGHLYADGNVGG